MAEPRVPDNFIERAFQELRKQAFPSAPPVELMERRRMFYTGAMAMIQTVEAIADTLPEDAAVNALEKIKEECRYFIVSRIGDGG